MDFLNFKNNLLSLYTLGTLGIIFKQNLLLPSNDSTFEAELSAISPVVFSTEEDFVVLSLLSSCSTMIDFELLNAAI